MLLPMKAGLRWEGTAPQQDLHTWIHGIARITHRSSGSDSGVNYVNCD